MKILKGLFIFLFTISLASPVNALESVTPYAVVCDPGYVSYTETSRIFAPLIFGNNGFAENNTSITQSISEQITRTVYATISGGSSIELNFVAGKIGYKVEVSAGVTSTKSQTIVVSVPPYSALSFSYGSATLKTTGTLKYLNKNCSYTYKSVVANYAYGSYYKWN